MNRRLVLMGAGLGAVVAFAAAQPYFNLDAGEFVSPDALWSKRPNQVWSHVSDYNGPIQFLAGPGIVHTIGIGDPFGSSPRVWVMGFDGQEDPIQLLPQNTLIYGTDDLNLRFSDQLIVAFQFLDDPDEGWVPVGGPDADFAILWHPLP